MSESLSKIANLEENEVGYDGYHHHDLFPEFFPGLVEKMHDATIPCHAGKE